MIHLRAEAPTKPAPGAPCNGCGVCCAWRPCPAGVLLSGRLTGPCVRLDWDADRRQYRCGLLATRPADAQASPGSIAWLGRARRRWSGWRLHLARRWIAAGAGCDCDLEVERSAEAVQGAEAVADAKAEAKSGLPALDLAAAQGQPPAHGEATAPGQSSRR